MRPDYAWPKARTKDLVIQEANQETLVYDKKSHQAHCLNPLVGLVWRHCDGQRSWQDLARIAHEALGAPNDSQVVELALHELAQAKLLLTDVAVTPEQKQYTRRQVARRFGVGAAAALLLAPLITTASAAGATHIVSPSPTTTAHASTTAGAPTTPGGSTTSVPTTPP